MLTRADLDRLALCTQPLPEPDMRPILAKAGMSRHEARDEGLPLPNGYISARLASIWNETLRRRARRAAS